MLKGEVVNDRTNRRYRIYLTLALFLTSVLGSAMPLAAQSTEQSSSERKVITRVEPEYPDALKRLYIGGVVRLEVEVAANGVVKSTKLLWGKSHSRAVLHEGGQAVEICPGRHRRSAHGKT